MNSNGGIVKRTFANLFDSLLVLVVLGLPLTVLTMNFEMGQITGVAIYTISALLLIGVITVLYHAYFVSMFGATLGKMLFGLKIVDYEAGGNIDFKTAFLRTTVGYMFSAQFFGFGYWKIVKHPERLAWHDELFGTKVIVTGSPLMGAIGLVVILIAMVYMGYLTGTNLVSGTYTSTQPIPTQLPDSGKQMFL